ncbi:MAG: RimK family alpha-L-glutamate ligase, partial [Niameybacter sp.]
ETSEWFIDRDLSAIDFVLFLDKDIRLAKQLEGLGLRVFNSAKVIEICDDKGMTTQALAGKGFKIPKTMIAPLVFRGMYREQTEDRYIEHVEKELGYPMIIKECFGSFGMQVYKVDDRKMLTKLRSKLADTPHLYQAFIKSSCGKDVRIHVVGGKVVASMLRMNKEDFRANITTGGTMQIYEPSDDFKQLAIDVCTQLGADFAGVDILFGESGEPLLCEVNSNAHIKNILDLTGINVAEEITAYILKQVAKSEGTKDEGITCL